MDKMRFRMFTWPRNPEYFQIYSSCEPKYEETASGEYEFVGLEDLSRVISGRGVFCGPDAVDRFNSLAVIMATRQSGELFHPVWGTSTAYLTELKLEQESRPDYIVYSFVFRETNEDGTIPRLPSRDQQE